MATIKDVAAIAGVSFTTVSHVVNNTRPVSADVRSKVELAIRQLNYVPSAVARSLKARSTATIAIELAIFVVAAVPGYALAIARMDRIGHRRLQFVGFVLMGACFAVIGLVPGMTTVVVPFLLAYGISYFFTEFGPNMTTFVLPGELFPTRLRATGHGISAGVGKLGAFIGVFLFPVLQGTLGLRGTLLLTAGISILGALLTLVLPEPAGRTLEEISAEVDVVAEAEQAIRDAGESSASTSATDHG